MCRIFIVLIFFLLFLDRHVEGRRSRELAGKGKMMENFDVEGLESQEGHQQGRIMGWKRKRKDKQIPKSRRQKENEIKRKKKKRPGRRPKTGTNRRKSKKQYGKGTSGQKRKRQQNKKKKLKKKDKGKEKKKKKLKQKKDKEKEKKRDDERKHNRTCSVESSCIVNAQTVLLYEKNQVSNYLKQSARLKSHYSIAGNKLVKNTSFQSAAKYLLWAVGGDLSNPYCGDMTDNSTKGLETKAAGLRFIVSNYTQLSNCSQSITKECTISNETFNSTIAETMSGCNATMWDFILVSRGCFALQQKSKNATEVCSCWQTASDLVTALKTMKCSTQARVKMITKQKNACKKVFKECKDAEDTSVNLIYNCMNEHSLKYINQTAKDLHIGIVTDAKTLYKTLEQGKNIDWMIS